MYDEASFTVLETMQEFLEWATPGSEEWRLARQLDRNGLPRHIAIIMDGNGRWAKKRLLPRAAGHNAGVKPVRETIAACCRLGIDALTLYAFSVENWKRPKAEIDTLWSLLRNYLRKELSELKANGVRFETIGRIDALPDAVQHDIQVAVEETASNKGLRLYVALNYSGRTEIIDAVNRILQQGVEKEGVRQISEQELSDRLYTADIIDPDLLIRTSGEFRLSNFLLWQIAYSEIWVTDRFWPDFQTSDLLQALLEYQKRDRRYGGLRKQESIPEQEFVLAGERF